MQNDDTSEWSNTDPNAGTMSGSAEETKEKVREKVAKGVAAVAGALKGFSEEAQKNDLAGSTKDAIQKAGETTRELASATRKEFKETKDAVTSGPGPVDADSSSTPSVSDLPRTGHGASDEDIER